MWCSLPSICSPARSAIPVYSIADEIQIENGGVGTSEAPAAAAIISDADAIAISPIAEPSTPTVSRRLHSPSPPSSPTVPASIIEPHRFSTPADGGEATRRRGVEMADRDDGTRRGTEATRLNSGRKRDVSTADGDLGSDGGSVMRVSRGWKCGD
ncbi:ribosome-recycling factor [Striga asiatica]|uniref:Ribosome-recycling factor n=1 Tax=Striga asiatica TaxID=4170 RepID=A0A5A7QFX8_STRAF|nr:ribosome-recycling factor [Striga asiatica]